MSQYSEDPFQLVLGQNPQTDLRNQGAYTDLTQIFSPRTVGQVGFHFDRVRASLLPTPEFEDLLAPLGFATPLISQTDLAQIGPGIQFPRFRAENRFKLFSNLSRTMGRHTLKVGWSITRPQVNDLQSNNSRGTLSFLPDFGRTAVQNFLLGTPELFTIAIGNLYRGFRNWEHVVYLEDEFRISPTFSINMGVRYEVETSPTGSEQPHRSQNADRAGHRAAVWVGVEPRAGKAHGSRRLWHLLQLHFPVTYQTTRFNPPSVQVLEINTPSLVDALALAKPPPP